MGALDDAMLAAQRKGGHPRQLDRIMEQMDADDAKKLVEVYLPDRAYSVPQIVRALNQLGFTVSRSAIADWRTRHAPR